MCENKGVIIIISAGQIAAVITANIGNISVANCLQQVLVTVCSECW